MNDTRITIEPIARHQKAAWRKLYNGYAAFYEAGLPDAVAERVWGWLHDPDHPLEGVIALAGIRPLGIAHFRACPNPLRGAEIGFLDDLFVLPDERAQGAGRALLDHIHRQARRRGWSVVRWITAAENERARALYDQVADGARWDLYEMRV